MLVMQDENASDEPRAIVVSRETFARSRSQIWSVLLHTFSNVYDELLFSSINYEQLWLRKIIYRSL